MSWSVSLLLDVGKPPPNVRSATSFLSDCRLIDLLTLLDLDSSLTARKELAHELNIHVGEDGSAEENIALHKAVMDKLAENGGVVPDRRRN